MSLSWKNLYISALNKNLAIKSKYVDLVKGTSGCVNPGEVLAIMGPSGGGKSTLLNALAGYIPKNSITQGSITYNDNLRCKNTWFREIGYVDQDMCLLDDLTVMETLYYHHRFKNSMIRKKGKNNNNENIKNTIRDLELEKVEKNLIKKLSGGERKRTCIGTTLINNPSILFLDEPTSGLDAATGLKIVNILKKLAIEQNKIIILTIHQPSTSIFKKFDHLILLSEGNVLFQGKPNDAESYFADIGLMKRPNASVCEHILEICSKDFKLKNPDLFNNENGVFKDKCVIKDKKKMKLKNDSHFSFIPSPMHVLTLLQRRFNIIKRNKWDAIKQCFSNTIIPLIIITVFFVGIKFDFFLVLLKLVADIDRSIPTQARFSEIATEFFPIAISASSNFIFLTTSIYGYFKELKMIKTELIYQHYSTSSFYTFNLIFLYLHYLCSMVILLFVFIIMFWKCNLSIVAIFLFIPMISVIIGLFFTSITPIEQLGPFMGSLYAIGFAPMHSIHCMLDNLQLLCHETYVPCKKIVFEFTYLFFFTLPGNFIDVLGYQIYRKRKTDIDLYVKVAKLCTFGGNQVRIECLWLLLILSTFGIIFLSFFILNLRAPSNTRLETEVPVKNKK